VGGSGGLGGERQVGKHDNSGGYSLHLDLGQPPLGRDDDNDEFFGEKRFQTGIPARLTARFTAKKGVTSSLKRPGPRWPQEGAARTATRGFETASIVKKIICLL
jgi:hypothetical protein